MDFSKFENIIFVAASGVIALFLFIMAFYVISKGHRKTSGLDIFLRIFTALVLIVSAGLFALALFTGFTGSFRIAVVGDKAAFIIGDSVTELPLGVIFATLATSTGQTIVIALFVIAFMTLVGDCLLAKKKYGKKTKPQKTQKTPEELKREAELEKIRKLSAAAVKKSNAAADKVSASDKKDKAEEKKQEPESAEQKQEERQDDEPSFDWRVGEPQKKNEFVGLHSTAPGDDFDTFDDIGESDKEETEAPASDDFFADAEGQERQDDSFDEAPEEKADEPVAEERPWYEQDDPADDERIIAEALFDEPVTSYANPAADKHDEPQALFDEQEKPADDFAEARQEALPEEELDQDEQIEEQEEISSSPVEEQETEEEATEKLPEEEQAQDEVPWYEQGDMTAEEIEEQEEQIKEEEESEQSQEQAQEQEPIAQAQEPVAQEEEKEELDDYDGIEPNRNIYIPGIRTVSRPSRTAERRRDVPPARRPEPKPEPEVKPESEQKKPAPARRTAAQRKANEPEQKRPAAQRRPTSKKVDDETAGDPKKLPVTRRYVILDRTSAVNIFNNYLKEREKSGKDKLESSINTIIIK